MNSDHIDWTKVTLIIFLVAGGGYAAKDKVSIPDWNFGTASRSVPQPTPAAKQAVQPVVFKRGTNPLASKVLGEYFADFAWMVLHGAPDQYLTGRLERQLDLGGKQLLALKEEVGDSDLSGAINESFDSLWGTTSKQISKQEAASAIYAVAWALR